MSENIAPDPELTALVTDFFSETFTPDVVTTVEREGFPSTLWKSTQQLGLPLVGIADSRGGSGGTLLDLLVVLMGAGRHTVPLPLAETNLAAWLLASAGADVPSGPMTVVPDASRLYLDGNRLSGVAEHVPWVRAAARVVAIIVENDTVRVVSMDPACLKVEPGADLAGMPNDRIAATSVEVESYVTTHRPDELLLRGALLRSAQMAGAMTGAFELTRGYVTERVQFGRPIGKFQSVQTHIVELAQAAVLSTLAVERAGRAALQGPGSLEIIATKSIANRHAGLATRAAHQAHGALGMTREYRLQHLTRRLHSWRGEFGDEVTLNLRLGAVAAQAAGFSRTVTSVGSTVGV